MHVAKPKVPTVVLRPIHRRRTLRPVAQRHGDNAERFDGGIAQRRRSISCAWANAPSSKGRRERSLAASRCSSPLRTNHAMVRRGEEEQSRIRAITPDSGEIVMAGAAIMADAGSRDLRPSRSTALTGSSRTLIFTGLSPIGRRGLRPFLSFHSLCTFIRNPHPPIAHLNR